MIAIQGSGGKSTILKNISQQLSLKHKVCCFTTTKMETCQLDFVQKIYETFTDYFNDKEPPHLAAVGIKDQVHIKTPMQVLDFELLASEKAQNIIFVYEADGAHRLPLKINKNDPVFLPQTTHVISVIGLQCFNQPIKNVCFRSNLFIEKYNQVTNKIVNEEQIIGFEELEFARNDYIQQWNEWQCNWRNFNYQFETKNNQTAVQHVFNQIDLVKQDTIQELRRKYANDAFGHEDIIKIVSEWF
ncbi:Putative_selenium-dependent hydroxylase accessory protein [Hexamita inflata]|uniref:Selenium-dependent hydroxylase accessory protein n=1 Tax=Hexamita inflata TaxID=28002 RepID=A0AA86PPV0_9EUKA|nr:Putative selenium-dependent hydroxylase accessory protein [Hexamita inflata]